MAFSGGVSKINAYFTNFHVMHILCRIEVTPSLAFNVGVEPYIIVRGDAVATQEQKRYILNPPSSRQYSNKLYRTFSSTRESKGTNRA